MQHNEPELSFTELAAANPAGLASTALAAVAAAARLVAQAKTGPGERLPAFDEAVAALANTGDRLDLISVTHPDAQVREAAESAKQVIAKYRTELSLDQDLYATLVGLDVTDSDDATRFFVHRTLRDFRRSGVDRDAATRARVSQLQDELVTVGQAFDRNIRTDTRTVKLPPTALAGLPPDFVAAHPAGPDGLVAITTDYPDINPMLAYSTDASAREQLWRQFRQRGYPANIEVLSSMLRLRHELATLLGYPNYAQYAAEDKMVGSADNIADFIERIAAAAADRATDDYAQLLTRKLKDEPEATQVNPWDAGFLSDRIRAEQFAFDSQAMRPYFEYNQVKAGLMALAEKLFNVRFQVKSGLPLWHNDVEAFDVYSPNDDTDASAGAPAERLIGRFYLDMHPRPNKFTHAAMFPVTTGKAGVRIPECVLVCNFPRPGELPALLLHSEVQTFFHEFGHLLHHIFAGGARWSGVSGVATEWDFVEAPSQLLEEWIRDAGVLATFAHHHSTGAALPAELVAKLRAADEFGKGLMVRQQMFYAALSLELYRADPAGLDPIEVERQQQERLTPYRYVEDTYLHLGFGHLDGYSAIYCTYMWSLVIAKDLFTVFAQEGLLNTQVAQRYRDRVLAPGGSAPAAQLVASFLGRPYDFAAYQAWLDS